MIQVNANPHYLMGFVEGDQNRCCQKCILVQYELRKYVNIFVRLRRLGIMCVHNSYYPLLNKTSRIKKDFSRRRFSFVLIHNEKNVTVNKQSRHHFLGSSPTSVEYL